MTQPAQNPYQHLPYQCKPRGVVVDPRIMPFDRATRIANSDPDAAMRRVAVLHHPDIIHVWAEQGIDRATIARLLGFSNWHQFRFWLYDRNLLDAFTATYRNAADQFSEAADLMELFHAGIRTRPIIDAMHYYGDFTPDTLRRMAGRNNPDKYTTAGKLKAPPATPHPSPATVEPTGGWLPA